jgi:hypothetical protein
MFFLLFLNLYFFNFSNTYSTSLNPDSTIFGQPNKITIKHLETKHYTKIKPKIQTFNFPSFNPEPNKNQTNLLVERKYFRNPILSFQNQTGELPLRNSWTGLEPPDLMDRLEPPDLREQVLLHEESASRGLGSGRSAPSVSGGAQSA